MNGLILRTTRVKDSDVIADFLLDDERIVTAYAGHVQHSRAYPNGLELMHVYEVEVVERPGQEIGRLKSACCVEGFEHILSDMTSYSCACAALESVGNVCPKDASVVGLFSTLLSVLAVMNTVQELSTTALAWFECFLLDRLGAMPNLDICAQCAGTIQTSEWFQQEVGFICPTCAHHQTNLPGYVLLGMRRLRDQTLRTTVQNALARNDEAQRRKVLAPVLKFLAAVMGDNSPIRRFKAHRFMAETAFGETDWV